MSIWKAGRKAKENAVRSWHAKSKNEKLIARGLLGLRFADVLKVTPVTAVLQYLLYAVPLSIP